ncbi:hypothetical protein PPYR_08861 [Photinus pyralis]|uniref:Uncharacterized protein n=1 Tax=Photinus pyralis TaxID=7054 RepID=A0A5N4AKX1_PHOPY|nr:uncharacterized protein LOC116171829 [Photinus pyralis]KAB0797868.1 hypothetical protein PPYR_08861 [Photinus pyralis]
MLSRRDKLLILPWQQRKYENHLRKVKSAAPVIDNRPPVSREHVAVKLKRKQTEIERQTKIERDNLILLQKLQSLTRKNRVDNYWQTPPPNFLNRVRVREDVARISLPKTEMLTDWDTVKTRCSACSSAVTDRLPSSKNRSKSVPIEKLPTICEESGPKVRSLSSKTSKSKHIDCQSSQKLMLNRGSLVLEVNFPPDSYIKFQTGHTEKLIMNGLCQCRNLTKKI